MKSQEKSNLPNVFYYLLKGCNKSSCSKTDFIETNSKISSVNALLKFQSLANGNFSYKTNHCTKFCLTLYFCLLVSTVNSPLQLAI